MISGPRRAITGVQSSGHVDNDPLTLIYPNETAANEAEVTMEIQRVTILHGAEAERQS